MRVNIYAEEITQRIEIVEKTTRDGTFTGVRFYLELPVTMPSVGGGFDQVAGPFNHHPDDDDSAAVTFWGKRDIRDVLSKAVAILDDHHIMKRAARETAERNMAVGVLVGDVLHGPRHRNDQGVMVACHDYYDGKCNSLTHTCTDCPDRPQPASPSQIWDHELGEFVDRAKY